MCLHQVRRHPSLSAVFSGTTASRASRAAFQRGVWEAFRQDWASMATVPALLLEWEDLSVGSCQCLRFTPQARTRRMYTLRQPNLSRPRPHFITLSPRQNLSSQLLGGFLGIFPFTIHSGLSLLLTIPTCCTKNFVRIQDGNPNWLCWAFCFG